MCMHILSRRTGPGEEHDPKQSKVRNHADEKQKEQMLHARCLFIGMRAGYLFIGMRARLACILQSVKVGW
jgi:hypothetical protein